VKKKRSTEKSDEWPQRVETFLSSPLAERASHGLSDRISIALHVDGEDFFFRRTKGQNTLQRVESLKPDVHFWVPLSTLRQLLEMAEDPDTGVAAMGVSIFEHIFTKEESKKIRFRVDTGFLGLWSKGYFSVLKAGGPEVASYLARFGFNGLSAIKEVLKKIRA
jgi:hypothetical protein